MFSTFNSSWTFQNTDYKMSSRALIKDVIGDIEIYEIYVILYTGCPTKHDSWWMSSSTHTVLDFKDYLQSI